MHAASHIVLVVYGAMEHKMNMQVRKAVDTTCRSTLANVKASFVIQKLVLELTQSIRVVMCEYSQRHRRAEPGHRP